MVSHPPVRVRNIGDYPRAMPDIPARSTEDFAHALRAAIAARGLSLDRIRFYLAQRGHDLSVATLSYWQSGRSKPDRASSLAALGALEEVLGVPRAHLASLLPPRRPRRTVHSGERLDAAVLHREVARELEGLIQEVGLSFDDGLQRISVHDLITVLPDRTEGAHLVREILRAEKDGVDRMPIYFGITDPSGYPYIRAIRGCRVGQMVESSDSPLVAGELILEQPLWAGESILIEYELAQVSVELPSDGWQRGCMVKVRDMAMEVAFDPADLPDEVVLRRVVDGEVTEIPQVLKGSSIQHCETDFGPGLLAIEWSWSTPR